MAQLAGMIRKKYPGEYDDLDDDELEQKIVSKYPEYQDLVQPKEAPPALKVENPTVDRLLSEAKTSIAKPAPWEQEADEVPIDKSIVKPKEIKTKAPTSAESDKKSLLDTFTDSVSSLANSTIDYVKRHPRIQEALTGTSPEYEELLRQHGITGVKGPGLQEIPGVIKAGKAVADFIDPTDAREDRGFFRPFAAGAVEGISNILAAGADPRTVGTGPEIPPIRRPLPPQRGLPPAPSEFGPSGAGEIFDTSFTSENVPPARQSSEIPYRMEPAEIPIRQPIRAQEPTEVIPPEPIPEPVNLEPPAPKPFINPFESTAEPINFRVDQPAPLVPPEFQPVGEEELAQDKTAQASGFQDEDLYNLARERFGMGLERPTEQSIDLEQPKPEAPSYAREPITKDDRIADNIANETNPKTITETSTEWNNRAEQLEKSGDLSGAWRAREIARVANDRLKELKREPNKFAEGISRAQAPKTEDEYIRMEIGNREDMLRNMVSQYAEHGARVANKELLQNSIDATPTGGKIDIDVDYKTTGKGPSITVSDTGPGLPLDMIKNEYITLTGSGKRGVESATGRKSIGEMGVGKATYLLGTDSFEISTIAKESDGSIWKYEFGGTPEDMITGKIKVNKTKMPDKTPTGTKVRVYDKDLNNIRAAHDYLDSFSKYSNSPVEVNISSDRYMTGTIQKKSVSPREVLSGGKHVTSGMAPGGNFDITIPDNAVWNNNQSSTAAILTARGMFQGAETIYTRGQGRLPDRIVVNIEPTVSATDAKNYPLTSPTRERMKAPFKQVIIQAVDKNIMEADRNRQIADLQQSYDELAPIKNPINPFDKTDFVIHDPGGRYSAQEINKVNNNKQFRAVAEIMKDMLDDLSGMFKEETRYTTTKYGFILDDVGKGGINIPNPSSPMDARESAILINLFDALVQANHNPLIASERVAHIIMHEFNHNISREEGAGFTWSLSNVDSKFGTRRRANVADAIYTAIIGPEGNYAPELQELLSEHQTARGRQDTRVDLLSRSAEGGFIESEGQGGISYARKSDGKRTPTETVVNKLLQALEQAGAINAEQTANIRAERAKRFAAFEGVKTSGQAGAAKSLGKLRGEYEKMDFSEFQDTLNQDEINSLFDAIKQANITTGEKARGFTALFKLLNGEGVPQRNELIILNDVFGNGFGGRILELHGALGGAQIKLGKTANTMKALRSSLDLSAPLRQGIGLIHRPEWRETFIDMLKFFYDPEFYNYTMRAIQNDPLYLVGREAGLFLAKPDDLLTGEEAFLESYIPQLGKLFPPLKWGVNASERAYTGFLNELRFRTFKNLVKNAKDAGNEVFTVTTDEEGGHHIVPTEVTENLAKYINVSTGRGSLGRFDKISQELNTFIWSPKLLSSRLTMLNPKYYQNLDPFTKQEALKTLLAITGFGIVTGTLGALIGGKTLGNPLTGFLKTKRLSDMNWFTGTEPQMLSTDFGKSRFGENVVDPWAGFQQVIVATARFIAGEANGKPQTRAETVGNFTVNKLSPMAALAYEIGSAKKFTGKGQFEDKYGQKKYLPAEVANSFVPMFVQDLITVFKTHPGLATQIGLDLASLTGMGVQNYPEARTQQNRQKMKFRKPSL